ncbi:MAG: HEPN domain-containing protein [Chloroflexi bacterium]|nr:HEPN domain-containing protein [Chloroflexota bacterium]
MQHDPIRVADTRAWFEKAQEDLRAADYLFTAVPPVLGRIAFLCRQAAEKSLKGFLAWNNVPFRRTHSIEEIGEHCILLDPSFRLPIDQTVRLTEYAWKFRYPDSPLGPPEAEAHTALALARDLYEVVLSRLPNVVRP